MTLYIIYIISILYQEIKACGTLVDKHTFVLENIVDIEKYQLYIRRLGNQLMGTIGLD